MPTTTKLFLLVALLIAAPAAAGERASGSKLDEVQRGAQARPFSLEQTTHVFTKTADGGIRRIVVKENASSEQLGLIRAHLLEISRRFAQCDFSDPAKIHGADMPGLAALREANPGQISVEYEELPNGAQIGYSAEDPALIQASHQWFAAQLKDDARRAIPDHPHHPTHGR
jgi:hypothetical protein